MGPRVNIGFILLSTVDYLIKVSIMVHKITVWIRVRNDNNHLLEDTGGRDLLLS